MHGWAKASAQEEEQHQLPSVKIQEVPRGQHKEKINNTPKDLRNLGQRFDGFARVGLKRNYFNASHDGKAQRVLWLQGISIRWLQWPSRHYRDESALTERDEVDIGRSLARYTVDA